MYMNIHLRIHAQDTATWIKPELLLRGRGKKEEVEEGEEGEEKEGE